MIKSDRWCNSIDKITAILIKYDNIKSIYYWNYLKKWLEKIYIYVFDNIYHSMF
jgi:hypothetical protein